MGLISIPAIVPSAREQITNCFKFTRFSLAALQRVAVKAQKALSVFFAKHCLLISVCCLSKYATVLERNKVDCDIYMLILRSDYSTASGAI